MQTPGYRINSKTLYDIKLYSEPSQTSKMELFAKLVNGFSILDVWHGSKYTCIITALLLASRTQPFKPASRLEEIKHFQEAVDYLIS